MQIQGDSQKEHKAILRASPLDSDSSWWEPTAYQSVSTNKQRHMLTVCLQEAGVLNRGLAESVGLWAQEQAE